MSEPRLETPRLILRPFVIEDFDGWAAFAADEETMRYLGGVQPRAVAWRSFMTMAGAFALTGVSNFAIVDKATGAWIGRAGPWRPEGWPGNEVGWSLVRSAWGRGLAREAATAALDYAFDTLGWTEVVHCIDPANTRSVRLAAALGSERLGAALLPAPMSVEVDVWGQTRDAWRARAGRR